MRGEECTARKEAGCGMQHAAARCTCATVAKRAALY
jgi:hypothetical protein